MLPENFFTLTIAILALDGLLGDPRSSWHPVCMIGRSLAWYEGLLRKVGLSGYGGGALLFVLLCVTWVVPVSVVLLAVTKWNPTLSWVLQALLGFVLLAVRSLLGHAWAVVRACRPGDLSGARAATSRLVSRDTDKMSESDCRRAAVESLTESLTDGILSPLFYFFILGIPGMLLFKIVSTMDSMVGYRNERYERFGWFGARADDLLNYVPARAAFVIISVISFLLPGFSGRKALGVGWQQHSILPGPNAGWGEASAAGALQIRIVGPIWRGGVLVTERWIGDASDPTECEERDVRRAALLVILTTVVFCVLALLVRLWLGESFPMADR